MAKYSDSEIVSLIAELKALPSDWQAQVQLREVGVSKTRDFEIEGINKNKFRVILRQSRLNPLDFSIILGVYPPASIAVLS